jgi:peptidoglycan hydrolase-like protein with peptidoglycan-binding domain
MSGILSVAQSQIGIKESPSGSNRVKYSSWYNLVGPWCDMFVSWCAAQAGVANVVGKFAYCPSHVNYFKAKGWWHGPEYQPQPGDIIFFGRRGVACHVGIVERRNGSSSVTTIEGNTSVSNSDNGGCVMRRVRTYGNPYGSWGILGFAHPPYENGNGDTSSANNSARTWLQKGDKGAAVKDLQTKLIALGYSCGKCGADGDFGSGTEAAVISFQKKNCLAADGQAGVNTMAKLNALYASRGSSTAKSTLSKYDSWVASLQKECNRQGFSHQTVDGIAGPNTLKGCPIVKKGAKGNITRLLQQRLIAWGYPCGRSGADGDFGSGTRNAVIAFQKSRFLSPDGIVGTNTWRKLLGM